jgi:hypothetical protein
MARATALLAALAVLSACVMAAADDALPPACANIECPT